MVKEHVTAAAGFEVLRRVDVGTVITGPKTVSLTLSISSQVLAAKLRVLQAPPTPSAVERDLASAGEAHILYVVPHATASLKKAAAADKVIVVSLDDGAVSYRDMWHNEVTRVTHHDSGLITLEPQRSRRPAYGRYALMRTLLRTSQPRSQKQLAAETGITQAAVSNALKRLGDLVLRTETGWVATDPEKLFSAFIAGYPGPGGIETFWYSLRPPRATAQSIVEEFDAENVLISGDVGADFLQPWRRPRETVLYANGSPPRAYAFASKGLAEAEPREANVKLIVPADQTIWTTARHWPSLESETNPGKSPEVGKELTDPLIIAWDVLRAAGPDAPDALEEIRQYVLRNWQRQRP